MKKVISSLGLCLGLLVESTVPAWAVLPVTVNPDSRTEWSKVIQDPFDGPIVYDRNYDTRGSFAFVSSWSKQGIRATFTDCQTSVVGYVPVWRRPWRFGLGVGGYWGGFPFSEQQPIYYRTCEQQSPKAIRFAINGQQYTYENGAVTPELAAALKNAPAENMTVRLVWGNGATTDLAIGRATVEAWKTIFK